MNQEESRCRILEGRAKDFANLDRTAIEGADGDPVCGQDLVLGVQRDDVTFLLGAIPGQAGEMFAAVGQGLLSAEQAAGPCGLLTCGRDTAAQLDAGHDLTVGGHVPDS
jgi:hypothetical protein